MTPKEFKDIVDDAVANGTDRKDAEAYVRAGHKLGDDFGKGKTDAKPKAKKKPLRR